MQKTFLFFLFVAVTSVSFAQQAKTGTTDKKDDKTAQSTANPNAATVDFPEETYNFGEVSEGPQVTHEFKFTNNGKEPLILSNVKASCGCTTPSWPKDPILPGKESSILVTYNTQGRPGNFTKSITITSNANTPSKVIYIKGTVEKVDPAKFEPIEQPSMLSPKGTN
jgi:hypothetical protein